MNQYYRMSWLPIAMVILFGLGFSAPAQTLIQWGEAPSGAGTRGTNIIVPPNKNFTFTTNRVELLTYSGITNNPWVGGTNYYWDSQDRAPYFSSAMSDVSLSIQPVAIVEQANSGDRISVYGGNIAPGGTFRAMVMWPTYLYFTSNQLVTIGAVSLAINQRLNPTTTNQGLRVVVQEEGSFYISGAVAFSANTTTQSFHLGSQTWHAFSPFSNGTETIGSVVGTPPFTNVQAVGYYFTVQNGALISTQIGANVQFFRATGSYVTIPYLETLALLLLAGIIAYAMYRRHRTETSRVS